MKQLDVSISTGIFVDLTVPETIDVLSEAGYTVAEFSAKQYSPLADRHRDLAPIFTEIRKKMEDKNVSFPQGHLRWDKGLIGDEALDTLKRNIDAYQSIGVKRMVLHVIGQSLMPYEEVLKTLYDKQIKSLQILDDYLQGTDTVLLLENLAMTTNVQSSERILRTIHDLGDSKHFGVCLDTGHLNIVNGLQIIDETPAGFVRNTGSLLMGLHVNSNEGDTFSDQHLFPFSIRGHQPDWKSFMIALDETGYDYPFNFEVPGEGTNVPLPVRKLKLQYAKDIAAFMMSDRFISA